MIAKTPPACAAWLCVQTQSKREHLAARWLKRRLGIDVYVPRIRFRRRLPRGLVWFIEALFPNYLFARFEPAKWAQQIDSAPGVRGVVRFGTYWPTIPEEVIQNLRARVGPDQVHVIEQSFEPGEAVQLAGGIFNQFEAVVARVMPARARVTVLLEFLGRQTMVELDATSVARLGDQRQQLFQ